MDPGSWRAEICPELRVPIGPVIALCVALAAGIVVSLFIDIDSESGLPQALSVHAPTVVLLASLWPGRGLPRTKFFWTAVVGLVLALVAVGALMGRGLFTTLPIAGGALAYSMIVGLWHRRNGNLWAPDSVMGVVRFAGIAVVCSPILLLFGGYVGLSYSYLWHHPAIAATICLSASVSMTITGMTVVRLFFSAPPTVAWTQRALAVVIIPMALGAPLVVLAHPELPLSWITLLGPLAAALTMRPRAVALLLLGTSAMMWAFPADMTDWPSTAGPPAPLMVDLSMAFAAVVAIAVAVERDARAQLARGLSASLQTEESQGLLFGSVFDGMGDGVVVTETDGQVTMANQSAVNLVGADALEEAAFVEMLDQISGPAGRELDWQRGGEQRTLLVSRDVLDLQGTEVGLSMLVDVTAEQQRQRELESFAGTVAHDLKGPLTAVIGWLDTAVMEWEDEGRATVVPALRRANAASGRMRSLIEDYLTHAVAQDGRLAPVDLPLEPLIRDVASMYADAGPGSADQDGRVEFEIDAPHVVHGDPALIRQLFINLVTNAIKYSRPEEQAYLRITSTRSNSDADWVTVELADRGLGIQPGDEERIFGEFSRSDKDAATHQGLGLGLALCRTIVTRHGGEITAENNSWGGATFRFRLPSAGVGL